MGYVSIITDGGRGIAEALADASPKKMWPEMADMVREVDSRKDVRCIHLRGAG